MLDCINPIFLKEIRQLSRNNVFYSTLYLCYSVVLFASLIILEQIITKNEDLSGSDFFGFLSIGIGVVTCILFPLYYANKFSIEIRDKDSSLFFTTPLSPFRIMLGKLGFGLFYNIFFQLLAFPFLLLCSIGRGVSLEQIIITSVYYLFTSSLIVSIMLFLCSALTCVRNLVRFASFFFIFYLGAFAIMGSYGIIELFEDNLTNKFNFYGMFVLALAMILYDTVLFFVCTKSKITVSFANRSLAVKSLLVARILLVVPVYYIADYYGSIAQDFASVWYFTGLGYISSVIFFAYLNNLYYGKRVRAAVSRDIFVRFIQFFWFTGPVNDFLWGIATGFLSVALGILFARFDIIVDSSSWLGQSGLLIYAALWALVGMFIKRIYGKRANPDAIAIGFTIIAMIVMMIVPLFASISIRSMQDGFLSLFMNPFAMIFESSSELGIAVLIDLAILLIFTVLNIKTFLEATENFRPLVRIDKDEKSIAS